MRFGIEFGSYPTELDGVEVCRDVSRRAQIAYKNNFEALFAAQHYSTGPDAAILQSLPLLAYLAGQVPGMYLGTSIFLLPLHPPLMVAEYTATLAPSLQTAAHPAGSASPADPRAAPFVHR